MGKKINRNCSTCLNNIKGRICKALSMKINDRDLEGEIKCKYYAYNMQEEETTLGTRA